MTLDSNINILGRRLRRSVEGVFGADVSTRLEPDQPQDLGRRLEQNPQRRDQVAVFFFSLSLMIWSIKLECFLLTKFLEIV